MLISPPFVLDRNASETDADYLARSMPNSGITLFGTGIPEGSFPLSLKACWHGGLHLQTPADAKNSLLPVCAIADGEIVYARKPTKANDTASPGEPRNYNPYGSDPAWTDDGCVIIKHKVKMGSTQPNQTDEVIFLSIHMHLSELRGAAKTAAGGGTQTVKRKEVIGISGKIYGQGAQSHVEIVCDDDNLKRLVGRITGDGNADADGRRDLVFGQIYFQLPVGTKFYAAQPAYNTATPTAGAAFELQGQRLYVGIDYRHGDAGEAHRGEALVTTYSADGSPLGAPLTEADGEYGLYQTALDIRQAYLAAAANTATTATAATTNTTATPAAPEAGVIYELLRFGRVIGPKALTPADVPHWRQVRYPGGEGWVNLNATGICKSSDADFPAWRGWKLIEDDHDGDSRCDSEQLIHIVKTAGKSFRPGSAGWAPLTAQGQCKNPDAGSASAGGWQTSVEPPSGADAGIGTSAGTPDDSDGPLTRAKLEARLKLDPVRQALQTTICKLPTEWDRNSAEARWKWLLTDKEFGLEQKDFDELMAHVKALGIDWGAANTGIGTTHWHFHPRQFMRLCRSFCVWPDLIRRWQEAETNHALPDDDGLDDFAKTALYEYGLRASLAAIRDHQDHRDFAAHRALDKIADNKAVIFGMRVHTDINANDGRGLWDDRVTLLKRDNTGLVELIFRGRYTTEPSGHYLHGGEYGTHPEGTNVGGTSHKDIGRLLADRSYEYAPYYRNNNAFGAARFGNNQFNILRKTVASNVERLVTNVTTLPSGEHVSENNAHWETGATAGYSENQSMHFHKGYNTAAPSSSGVYGMTGSAGCQTFPPNGDDTFDRFMQKLEPLKSNDRFEYVLKVL